MSPLIPSFIVLGALLITLILMLRRAPNRKLATIMNSIIMTALCFVGGMLVSAMYTRAVGNEHSNPYIIAILVAIGTFASLAIYIKIDEKQKLTERQRHQSRTELSDD